MSAYKNDLSPFCLVFITDRQPHPTVYRRRPSFSSRRCSCLERVCLNTSPPHIPWPSVHACSMLTESRCQPDSLSSQAPTRGASLGRFLGHFVRSLSNNTVRLKGVSLASLTFVGVLNLLNTDRSPNWKFFTVPICDSDNYS